MTGTNTIDMISSVINIGKKKGFLTVDDITKYADKYNLNDNEVDELYKTCIDNNIEIKEDKVDIVENPDDKISLDDSYDYDTNSLKYESSLQIYLKEAKRINILPFEEQKELIKEYKNGSKKAEHRLTENYLPLVIDIAKRYKGRGLSFDDLIQEGNLGLIKGLEKYDPDKGYMISTYVTFWIKQAITRAIADTGHVIRIPVHAYEVITKIQSITKEYENEYGYLPSVKYIADKLNVSEEKIREYVFYMNNIDLVSLETPLKEDDDSTLMDFIADTDTSETPENYADNKNLRAAFEKIFEVMPERECDIIKHRFGFYNGKPMTLEQVGELYGITRERVRQIEAKALRKLKSPRFAGQLRDFIK